MEDGFGAAAGAKHFGLCSIIGGEGSAGLQVEQVSPVAFPADV